MIKSLYRKLRAKVQGKQRIEVDTGFTLSNEKHVPAGSVIEGELKPYNEAVANRAYVQDMFNKQDGFPAMWNDRKEEKRVLLPGELVSESSEMVFSVEAMELAEEVED